MINLVTGVLAMVMIVVFLGYYAISIKSVPLGIIIVAILVMVAVDFIKSLRGKDEQGNAGQKTE